VAFLCKGTDSEKPDWFKTINIAGKKLTDQELRNAVYHGPWVTKAKQYFSKSGCAAYSIASDYMGSILSPIRQDYLETAISWVNDSKIDEYMAAHQHDTNGNELWLYFQSVIAWVEAIFPKKRPQMKSVKWGPLYDTYKGESYDPDQLESRVAALMADTHVEKKTTIYEFLLGGEADTKLLQVRVFDEKTKLAAYGRQTRIAEATGASNCPIYASAATTTPQGSTTCPKWTLTM